MVYNGLCLPDLESYFSLVALQRDCDELTGGEVDATGLFVSLKVVHAYQGTFMTRREGDMSSIAFNMRLKPVKP